MDLPKIKIYTPVMDEIREVKTEDEKKAWMERMKASGHGDFKQSGGVHILDTCCGGRADDCGVML